MSPALHVEWWKLRRSPVTLVATVLMGMFIPGMGLGFYWVAVNGGTGAIAGKASALLTGEGWVGYLGFVDQIAAVAVFAGAGVVVAWMFGREHVDRTFPALFALPVSRGSIAAAKFVVLAAWMIALSLIFGIVALTLGLVAAVGPLDLPVVTSELVRLLVITLGAGTLSLTIGIAASWGRGYLPAIGVIMVTIAVAQVAVLFGTGGWFPYAVPGLMAVAGSEGAPDVSLLQVALVPGVAFAGIWLTVRWWTRAEVN